MPNDPRFLRSGTHAAVTVIVLVLLVGAGLTLGGLATDVQGLKVAGVLVLVVASVGVRTWFFRRARGD